MRHVSSMAINGNLWQSMELRAHEARLINGNLWQSISIDCNQWHVSSVAINCNQLQSMAINGAARA